MISVKGKNNWCLIISRGGLFFLIWWILTDGVASSWWIGGPAILLAVATSTILLPPGSFVWYEFLKFVPFFLLRSLRGGIDVAWRVFHPAMPMSPVLIEYPHRLPTGMPQVFMANSISLLPGTLSAELDQDVLKIHVLDSQGNFLAELEEVEQRVARMFDASLKVSEGDR